MTKTFYVVVFSRWVSKGKSGRWSLDAGVMPEGTTYTDARLRSTEPETIGIYEVQATSRSEAMGIGVAWLAKGRPLGMTVHEVAG